MTKDEEKKGEKKGGPKKWSVSFSREIWIGLGAIAVVWVLIMLSFFSTIYRVTPEVDVDDVDEEQALRHPLTGEVLEEELEELPWVFGVMVENSVDAWPLSGLDQAFLVIEAPVEAGIPRFLAFYSEESEAEKIGPVRSARPYYLDWNDELDAIYAHVGGSPESLELIDEYEMLDLNQFWHADTFYRENGTRYAPHNVYTNSELLMEVLDELKELYELEVPVYEAWNFKDDAPALEDEAESLLVDFAEWYLYEADWQYDAETNTYLRYQGREMMEMDDGATIFANNVVVIATDVRTIDAVGRKSLETIGEGDALIAQDGEVYFAQWKNDEREERLRFYTVDGYEISLNAGVTWIEVVSDLAAVDVY